MRHPRRPARFTRDRESEVSPGGLRRPQDPRTWSPRIRGYAAPRARRVFGTASIEGEIQGRNTYRNDRELASCLRGKDFIAVGPLVIALCTVSDLRSRDRRF